MANLADRSSKRSRLLFLSLLLMLGGCIYPFVNDDVCNKFDDDLKITQWPPSTQILKEKCSTGFNPTYQATLTILAPDLSTLQQQVPFNKVQQWRRQTSSQIFSHSAFQQKGKDMRSLLYADYSDGAYLMEVLINTSDPQKYVVYVSNSYVD